MILRARIFSNLVSLTSLLICFQRLVKSLKPTDNWGPHDEEIRGKYKMKDYVYPKTWWRKLKEDITGTNELLSH